MSGISIFGKQGQEINERVKAKKEKQRLAKIESDRLAAEEEQKRKDEEGTEMTTYISKASDDPKGGRKTRRRKSRKSKRSKKSKKSRKHRK